MSNLNENSAYLARKKELEERRKKRQEKYAINYQNTKKTTTYTSRKNEDVKFEPKETTNNTPRQVNVKQSEKVNNIGINNSQYNESYQKRKKELEERRRARTNKYYRINETTIERNKQSRSSRAYERKETIEKPDLPKKNKTQDVQKKINIYKKDNYRLHNTGENSYGWQNIKEIEKANPREKQSFFRFRNILALAILTGAVSGLATYNYVSDKIIEGSQRLEQNVNTSKEKQKYLRLGEYNSDYYDVDEEEFNNLFKEESTEETTNNNYDDYGDR